MKITAIDSMTPTQTAPLNPNSNRLSSGASQNTDASATVQNRTVETDQVFDAQAIQSVLEQEARFYRAGSGSSVFEAYDKNVNILAHSDSIAQEMLRDMKGSMSLSGESGSDISLPDHVLSVSASSVKQPEKTQKEPALLSSFLTEIQNKKTSIPVVEIPQTNLEQAISMAPPDQIFSPNKEGMLPPTELPADISFVHDPMELQRLEQQADEEQLRVFTQESEANERELLRSEDLPQDDPFDALRMQEEQMLDRSSETQMLSQQTKELLTTIKQDVLIAVAHTLV